MGTSKIQRSLDKLAEQAYGNHPMIIVGDLNAWAVDWESHLTKKNKVKTILEGTEKKLDVSIVNVGNTSTYTICEASSTRKRQPEGQTEGTTLTRQTATRPIDDQVQNTPERPTKKNRKQ